MRYAFHPEAETEFMRSVEYYEERDEGLGYISLLGERNQTEAFNGLLSIDPSLSFLYNS